tara:strand:- start:5946 stop:7331 length:1386 start_codon:yes stop_codon:yes gene_type:complete
MSQQILIVEDDHLQRQMLVTLLQRKLEYQSLEASNGREALKVMESEPGKDVKLIIMDIQMPIMSGMETLEVLKQKYPFIPVIMLTGSKDINDAVWAMKLGAIDFLTKPYEGERMVITVQNALKISTLSREVSRLKSEKEGRFTFENLIGYEDGLSKTVTLGRKAADCDLPVLITGETGTGKEVFARAIHGESSRAGKPFIAVNCGAIPSQLVESTLFGHEKGAFTGATDKAIGKFREADGGTIFLDEVGELPLDTQVKLLRVLQQKEVEPVGAGKPISVNVRILSATNRDLESEVSAGNFREDLFFRLNVLPVHVPSLRERAEDIPSLAHHFIERFCAMEGGLPKDISQKALSHLTGYDWPGNVRQLENIMNRAMALADNNILELDDFSSLLSGKDIPTLNIVTETRQAINLITDDGGFKPMQKIEDEAIQLALEHYDHNITQAAKALGMAKSTFYKKIKS